MVEMEKGTREAKGKQARAEKREEIGQCRQGRKGKEWTYRVR